MDLLQSMSLIKQQKKKRKTLNELYSRFNINQTEFNSHSSRLFSLYSISVLFYFTFDCVPKKKPVKCYTDSMWLNLITDE